MGLSKFPLMDDEIQPRHLDGIAALLAAERTKMCKQKGERDTEFVKRIVCAYLNADSIIKRTKPTP